ncbi:MAG TPA: hypothetical protein VGN42_06310, partial [Pirellulales bacterium]|nr:hypothetical protein [Pirellulales bacterium]
WRDSIAQGAALGKKSIEKPAALKGRNGERPDKASNGRPTFDSVVTVSGPAADPSRPVGASDRRGASRKPRAAPWANEFDPFGVEEMRYVQKRKRGKTGHFLAGASR